MSNEKYTERIHIYTILSKKGIIEKGPDIRFVLINIIPHEPYLYCQKNEYQI